jgi:hypothetical protein
VFCSTGQCCHFKLKSSGIVNKLSEIKEFLNNVHKEENILHKIKRKKANWTGHLRRNCLLKHVTEGKVEGTIEVTGRR